MKIRITRRFGLETPHIIRPIRTMSLLMLVGHHLWDSVSRLSVKHPMRPRIITTVKSIVAEEQQHPIFTEIWRVYQCRGPNHTRWRTVRIEEKFWKAYQSVQNTTKNIKDNLKIQNLGTVWMIRNSTCKTCCKSTVCSRTLIMLISTSILMSSWISLFIHKLLVDQKPLSKPWKQITRN